MGDTYYLKASKAYHDEQYDVAHALATEGYAAGEIKCGIILKLLAEKGRGCDERISKETFPVILELAKQGDEDANAFLLSDKVPTADDPREYSYAFSLLSTEWMRRAAEEGYAPAQYEMGRMAEEYADDSLSDAFDDEDEVDEYEIKRMQQESKRGYKEAAEWYRIAAEQGHVEAQYALGFMYQEGRGVEYSLEKAAEWYRKAAEQGHALAQCRLGSMYAKGEGVEQSPESAIEWWTKAAEYGEASAKLCLGNRLYAGEGLPQSHSRAVGYYTEAFSTGGEFYSIGDEYPLALFNLACLYIAGDGVEFSEEKALECLRKAEDLGYRTAPAYLRLGLRYAEGVGVPQSDLKALSYLCRTLSEGKSYDIGEESKRAFVAVWERLLDLAEAGEREVVGAIRDAMRSCGKVEWLESQTARFLTFVTEKATAGDAGARSCLGDYYLLGIGVEQSTERALEWYHAAEEKGSMMAVLKQGTIYAGMCDDVTDMKDTPRAIPYLEKAAEAGSLSCAAVLGILFYEGEEVECDYARAVKWLLKADEQIKDKTDECIFAEVRYYLGDSYLYGLGVARNLYKARAYFQKAIEGGYNCKFAFEMVNRDLALDRYYQEAMRKLPRDTTNRDRAAREEAKRLYAQEIGRIGMQKYIDDLLKKGLTPLERKQTIIDDLKKEFGKLWDYGLKSESKKAIVTALFDYSTRIELGPTEYMDQDFALDFSGIIGNLAKAYECELKEYFFVGLIRYLKGKGVSPEEFLKYGPEGAFPIIERSRKTGEWVYKEEYDTSFSLGTFYYILGLQRKTAPTPTSLDGQSVVSRSVLDYDKSGRGIDPYVLEYAKELFAGDAFGKNRAKEIVNYLIDLATDTKTIMDFRNPAAHHDIMTYDQAAITANYLVMIHKLIKHFLEKIDPKYREKGYFSERDEE